MAVAISLAFELLRAFVMRDGECCVDMPDGVMRIWWLLEVPRTR